MNDQIVPHKKGVFIQRSVGASQSQRAVGTGFDAKRFVLIVPAVQAKIAVVDQLRKIFRKDRPVGTRVRTGLAGDAAYAVPDQKFPFVFLLFQRFIRTGVHAVWLLASPADQGVGRKFRAADDAIISHSRLMKVITALDRAVFAFSRSAEIQVDKKALVRPLLRVHIEPSLVQLFRACVHRFNPRSRGNF
jgi:hypothetical protein